MMDNSNPEVSTTGNRRKACWWAGRAKPRFGKGSLLPSPAMGEIMPAPLTIYTPHSNQQWENPHDLNVFFFSGHRCYRSGTRFGVTA